MESVGRRASQKKERREWLLECARALLEESDFSMRRLSERADVADATPYNLFGSKRGVFEALYDDRRTRIEARLAAQPERDPLLKIFDAIGFLADDLDEAPRLHRAVYRALFEPSLERRALDESDSGVRFWYGLFVAAAHSLRPGARCDLLSKEFVYLLRGSTLDWTESLLDAQTWRSITVHGLALLTIPLARKDAVPQLNRYLAEAERSL
jgi:AcrR family transcriptional regulator